MFSQSIEKSEVLLLEKKLWDKTSLRLPHWETRKEDTISVVTVPQEFTRR